MSTETKPAPADDAPPGLSASTAQIAALLGAELLGRDDLVIADAVAIEPGKPNALTFIRDPQYAKLWPASRCSAALVTRGIDVPGHDPAERALLVVDNADLALVQILRAVTPAPHTPPPGVHHTAVVDASATVHPTAHVGPLCVIGPGTALAEHAILHSRVTLGAGVRIGPRTRLHAGVVVEDRCVIGADCTIHPNCVVGADGFGYHPDPATGAHVKIPHAGNAVLGDRVELGACTTVDRGKFGPTRIGDGVKIDNQTQIGHNCDIAENVIICGNCSFGGSVTVGPRAAFGGHSAVADHLSVGADVRVAGASTLIRSAAEGTTWMGNPAGPARIMMANFKALRDLARFMKAAKRSDPTLADLPRTSDYEGAGDESDD